MVNSNRSQLDVLEPILLVESCIIIASNAFGIYIIFKSKTLKRQVNGQKKLNKNHQTIILCLFISHVCLGVVQFMHATTIISGTSDKDIINLFQSMKVFFSSFEILFTVIMSAERFIAVKYPLSYTRHEQIFTGILFSSVAFLSIVALMLFLFYKKLLFLPLLATLFGGVIIFVSNMSLYRIVMQQQRKILSTMVHNSDDRQNEENKTMRKKQVKSLKVCVFMTATYICLWIPFVAVTFSITYYDSHHLVKIASIIEPFGYLNAICDVLIYLVIYSEAKSITKKTLKCCKINEVE